MSNDAEDKKHYAFLIAGEQKSYADLDRYVFLLSVLGMCGSSVLHLHFAMAFFCEALIFFLFGGLFSQFAWRYAIRAHNAKYLRKGTPYNTVVLFCNWLSFVMALVGIIMFAWAGCSI